MADRNESSKTAYSEERNTERSPQTGNINARNNNVAATTPGATEPTVESASDSGIGDAAVNDQKLTGHTSNHSGDA
jgi:hypothetical protein